MMLKVHNSKTVLLKRCGTTNVRHTGTAPETCVVKLIDRSDEVHCG